MKVAKFRSRGSNKLKKGILAILSIAFSLNFYQSLEAEYLFYESGLRVDVVSENPSLSEVVSLPAQVQEFCVGSEDNYCVNWSIHLGSALNAGQLQSMLLQALSRWSTPKLQHSVPTPVIDFPELDEAGVDEFGNPIVEGDFIVSFDPPSDIEFPDGRLVVVKHYLVPDFESGAAEIRWAGVYINPAYNPFVACDPAQETCLSSTGFGSFSLYSVIMYGIGKALGLEASTAVGSVMYPTQSPGDQVSYFQLSNSDQHQMNLRYGDEFSAGSLKGRVIDGDNGSPWKGAEILAIPLDSLGEYIEGDPDTVVASTMARKSGKFEFNRLPVGDYVLVAQSLSSGTYGPSLFGEWMQLYAKTSSFARDFYDGKGRETNLEGTGVSPQAVFYAASLKVIANEVTETVEIITQANDPNAEQLSAEGSSNETLSELIFKSINKEFQQNIELKSGGGGCQLSGKAKPNGFLGFLAVFLLTLVLWGRRVRSRTAEFQ